MALITDKSKYIDTKWEKVEFTGYGIIEISTGTCRHILGGDSEPTEEFIGAVMNSGERHEFNEQVVWIRAEQGKALVSIHKAT